MNFEEILNQWEMQTQHPYGKKRIRNETKNPAATYAGENTQTLNPMDYWLRRYGVYDKDADNSENTSLPDNSAEKRRLRAMRPQAEIDLHGMTLEEAYGDYNNICYAAKSISSSHPMAFIIAYFLSSLFKN